MYNFDDVTQEHQPQKLQFDFEGDNVPHNLPVAVKVIQDTFAELFAIKLGPESLVLCSSHSKETKSWHIAICGFHFSSTIQAKEFYNRVWIRAPYTLALQKFTMHTGSVMKDDGWKQLPNIEIITQVLPHDPLITTVKKAMQA